jgi:hypothetical protein
MRSAAPSNFKLVESQWSTAATKLPANADFDSIRSPLALSD